MAVTEGRRNSKKCGIQAGGRGEMAAIEMGPGGQSQIGGNDRWYTWWQREGVCWSSTSTSGQPFDIDRGQTKAAQGRYEGATHREGCSVSTAFPHPKYAFLPCHPFESSTRPRHRRAFTALGIAVLGAEYNMRVCGPRAEAPVCPWRCFHAPASCPARRRG